MATVRLDGAAITDWPSFHDECRDAFGFPDFYGRNMDAWVDCLSYLRDEDNMCGFRLQPDEILFIELADSDLMRRQAPDILDEMQFCIGEINGRYADYGQQPALRLVLR